MEQKNTQAMTSGWRFWLLVLGMGMAGQLCWNIENQWFTTFVYAKIGGNVSVVTAMVIASALVTTIATFVFGTLSDRLGKRKMFVCYGYIIWGIATILFGFTEYARASGIGLLVSLSSFLVVVADAVMSFFGSMGYDSGYNVWLNDHITEQNQGQVGASLAALPVLGTVVGTVLGGLIVNIGNPTVGTDHYDPSLDNYQRLFWMMGLFVIAIGIMALFIMRDHPDTRPAKEGTFWQHLVSVFRFSTLKGNTQNKEMFLANGIICLFFIPFNFYFVHLGNWLIYDIGMTSGDMGLIEGIGLMAAVLVTIPFIKLINKNKIPLVTLIAIVTNAIGLFLLYICVQSASDVNVASLFSLQNIPLFACVFLVGVGYVLIMQAGTIWVKSLFPEGSRGQFEGVRIIFFVLLPMMVGTVLGNIIIKNTPQDEIIYDTYGHPIDVPQENLFLYAAILVLFALIPLYFAAKEYKKRLANASVLAKTPTDETETSEDSAE